MTKILTLDPGGTTGWALGRYYDESPYQLLRYGMIPDGVDGFIRWWRAEMDYSRRDWQVYDELVSESFTLRPGVAFPDITPLRIEGALSVLEPRTQYQPPSAKVHAPDALLRANQLWLRGAGHDRDAVRHALAYLKMKKHVPTIEKYWNHDGI